MAYVSFASFERTLVQIVASKLSIMTEQAVCSWLKHEVSLTRCKVLLFLFSLTTFAARARTSVGGRYS